MKLTQVDVFTVHATLVSKLRRFPISRQTQEIKTSLRDALTAVHMNVYAPLNEWMFFKQKSRVDNE